MRPKSSVGLFLVKEVNLVLFILSYSRFFFFFLMELSYSS